MDGPFGDFGDGAFGLSFRSRTKGLDGPFVTFGDVGAFGLPFIALVGEGGVKDGTFDTFGDVGGFGLPFIALGEEGGITDGPFDTFGDVGDFDLIMPFRSRPLSGLPFGDFCNGGGFFVSVSFPFSTRTWSSAAKAPWVKRPRMRKKWVSFMAGDKRVINFFAKRYELQFV